MLTRGYEVATLAGRVLLAGIFLHEAWSKLSGYAAAGRYMQDFGLPGELLPLAIALEAGGGLAILLGYRTRVAAALFAGFCVLTAAIFHSTLANRGELLHFEKDLAIAGGFLILVAHGGGAWSLDALKTSGRK